ncbi:MAG: hypothetical protein AAGE43_03850 [Pseudomonadota bacterium]
MAHTVSLCAALTSLLMPGATLLAQPGEPDWPYEEFYDNSLVNLHQLGNYAYDLEWQLAWERQLLAGNGVRINTGSVTSNDLATRADINLNVPMNEHWRFQGSFRRDQNPEQNDEDELLVGLERFFGDSSLFAQVDPGLNKENIDFFAGYTKYGNEARSTYTRIGLLFEDIVYNDRNDLGGTADNTPVALRWAIRRGTERWWIYSDGTVGTGYQRSFDTATPESGLLEEERRDNRARIRLSHETDNGALWSLWFDWADFQDKRSYSNPEFDYNFQRERYNLAAEHIRTVGDVHRFRFLVHLLFQRAEAEGFNAHSYQRDEPLGGIFYERLWSKNSLMAAAVISAPNAEYEGTVPEAERLPESFADKLILGWRHRFSPQAQLLISVSHKVTGDGFGGGNVQFQMFF